MAAGRRSYSRSPVLPLWYARTLKGISSTGRTRSHPL
jgi:hypothetical protein